MKGYKCGCGSYELHEETHKGHIFFRCHDCRALHTALELEITNEKPTFTKDIIDDTV